MGANEGKPVSRRDVIGGVGMGIGLAAVAATPVFAQGTPATGATAGLQDPTTKYPRPPSPQQSQPWPGLASEMNPKPDHGETSYKGSGRLLGRKALITGGDSGMGRAAAIAYAREGADVAINYLPAEETDAQEVIALIKKAGRKGLALPGDIRDEAFCNKLVNDAVIGLGGLDIVVNNAGRQQQHASILDISTEEFDWTMKTNIYAPFWIIRAALPHMQPGSVLIGTTSEQAYDPSADLYDYAQTKAAIMNYTSRWRSSWDRRASASTPSPPGRSGRRCRSAAGRRWRSWRISAARPRSAAPASRRNSPRSTYSLPTRPPAMPTGRYMGRRGAADSRSIDCHPGLVSGPMVRNGALSG